MKKLKLFLITIMLMFVIQIQAQNPNHIDYNTNITDTTFNWSDYTIDGTLDWYEDLNQGYYENTPNIDSIKYTDYWNVYMVLPDNIVDNYYTIKQAKDDTLIASMILGTFALLNTIGDNVTPNQRTTIAVGCMAFTTFTFFRLQF